MSRHTIYDAVELFIAEAVKNYRTDEAFIVEMLNDAIEQIGVFNPFSDYECLSDEEISKMVGIVADTEDPLIAAREFVERMRSLYVRNGDPMLA